jgi:putative ABC transport system permease protein
MTSRSGPPDDIAARLQQALQGRYVLISRLQGGAMSAVFLARDESLDRRVVVKVLPTALANVDAVERFKREIATVASLSHPQVVPILAAGDVEGLPYFVMPYVEGESLSRRLARGPLSIRETVSVLVDVARALAFAHERGVVHRDIKPGNILLTADSAVVTDFGIAKARVTARSPGSRASWQLASDGSNLTTEGTSLGTPTYMAPEQIAGDDEVDNRADLYAFGVTGYEMLVGAPPFAAPTRRQLLSAHLVDAPMPITRRRQDVPPGLERIIMQCLAKDPSARPRTAMEVVRTLQDPVALTSLSQASDGTGSADHPRSAKPMDWVRAFLGDLKVGMRSLLRVPSITASALVCLGLGSGATLSVFSAIDRALILPLPFSHAHELVTVYRTTPYFDTGPFSAPNFIDLTRSDRSLDSLAALGTTSGHVSVGNEANTVRIVRASGALFSDLGAGALRGRLLGSDDARPGAAAVAILSEEYWRAQFGADPSAIGRTIVLDGVPTTVVGVLPGEFRVPHGGTEIEGDIWVPLRFTGRETSPDSRRSNFLALLGRLAPGATVRGAENELTSLMAGLARTYPGLEGESVRLVPLDADSSASVRAPLLLLFGAVCIVLLIATANVVCLLLARGVQRERETAIRAALGGSRWSVVRPVIAESTLLATAGIAAGCAVAWLAIRLIGVRASSDIPQLAHLSLNGRIIPVALLMAAIVTLLAGALPAWHNAGIEPQAALRGGTGGGAGRDRNRALSALVVAEVALSLMLLLGAGLVLKGFVRLMDRDFGFDRRPVLTVEAAVSPLRYGDGSSVRAFLEPALSKIAQLPGVDAVGAISVMPFRDWGYSSNIRYEGQPAERIAQQPIAEQRTVTPGLFQVTRQHLIAGRLLRDDDAAPSAPLVVVANDVLAKRDFPGQDPVGKRFYVTDTSFATIVGVVSSIANGGPVGDARPELDFAYSRASGSRTTLFNIMVRVRRGDPALMTGAVRTAIRSADSQAAVTRIMPMADVLDESVRRPRLLLSLIGVFAGVAVVLAIAGLYGVLSYAVAQRTRELGIRAALGCSPAQTVHLVARRGIGLAVIGAASGLAGAAAITRLLASILYGVSPLDGETWLVVTVGLLAATIVVTLIPSIRATQIDPIQAIRAE